MSTYQYPQMPLRMNVWYTVTNLPPTGPPDLTDVPCSLSPTKPSEFLQADGSGTGQYLIAHIIRTATNVNYADNHYAPAEPVGERMTVFEVPAGSGHYYMAAFAHVIGAGFANEHHRIFVSRYATGYAVDQPWYRGWI